jgi:hypothetical protein
MKPSKPKLLPMRVVSSRPYSTGLGDVPPVQDTLDSLAPIQALIDAVHADSSTSTTIKDLAGNAQSAVISISTDMAFLKAEASDVPPAPQQQPTPYAAILIGLGLGLSVASVAFLIATSPSKTKSRKVAA